MNRSVEDLSLQRVWDVVAVLSFSASQVGEASVLALHSPFGKQ